MKKLCVVLLLAVVCNAFSFTWLFWGKEGTFHYLEQHNVKPGANGHITYDCLMLTMDSEAALSFVRMNWVTKTNLSEYSIYAKHYRRWLPPVIIPPVVEPNEPPAPVYLVYITVTGARYHNTSHGIALHGFPVTIQEALDKHLTPCGTCQPGIGVEQ